MQTLDGEEPAAADVGFIWASCLSRPRLGESGATVEWFCEFRRSGACLSFRDHALRA
jgi:hypothetical protein